MSIPDKMPHIRREIIAIHKLVIQARDKIRPRTAGWDDLDTAEAKLSALTAYMSPWPELVEE